VAIYLFHFPDRVKLSPALTHINNQLKITGTIILYKYLFNYFKTALKKKQAAEQSQVRNFFHAELCGVKV